MKFAAISIALLLVINAVNSVPVREDDEEIPEDEGKVGTRHHNPGDEGSNTGMLDKATDLLHCDLV